MKTLAGPGADIAVFPSGHVYDSASGQLRSCYAKPWRDFAATGAAR
jgi:asparagine synthase (glutamine-hydrolysing)